MRNTVDVGFRSKVRVVALGMLVWFFVGGCATVVGTVTGPVAGVVSCVSVAGQEIEYRTEGAKWAPLLVIFSPVIGILNGMLQGMYVDYRVVSGRGLSHQYVEDLFAPCG